MNILNIEHVSKIYGDKVIFDDVSYGIHQGDKIGIIGINGTGKTTLLRIIEVWRRQTKARLFDKMDFVLHIFLRTRNFRKMPPFFPM